MEIRNSWFDFHGAPEPGPMVAQGVVDGLAPFRPKSIELYMDYDIDYNQYQIHATAVFRGGHRLTRSAQHLDRDLMLGYPDEISPRIAEDLFLAFRYREIWLAPDNVILGEN